MRPIYVGQIRSTGTASALNSNLSSVKLSVAFQVELSSAFRQIPHMTKSHHGGNMSLIGEVGFCHRHIPTIDNYDDEVGLGVFVDL